MQLQAIFLDRELEPASFLSEMRIKKSDSCYQSQNTAHSVQCWNLHTRSERDSTKYAEQIVQTWILFVSIEGKLRQVP